MTVFASAHRRKAQFLILIELCTSRNVVINHQKMKFFFSFFFVFVFFLRLLLFL